MAESSFERNERTHQARGRAAWALVGGLPALVSVIMFVGCLTLARDEQRGGQIRERYVAATQSAIEDEDWARGELFGRKLVDLRPNDPLGRYLIAFCAGEAGEDLRAKRLMQQIAPLDQSGYPAAHWWLVRHLAKQESGLTLADAEEVRVRLSHFLKTFDRHAQARMLLGQAELALGNPQTALDQMVLAADVDPRLQLTVAKVASRLGYRKLSRSMAEQACHWLDQQVRETPDDVDLRLQLAEGLVTIGEFASSADVLLEGLQHEPDPRLATRLVQLSVTAFDVLDRSNNRSDRIFDQKLRLVECSLDIAPDHGPSLTRLAHLSHDSLDHNERARTLLDRILQQSSVPAAVHTMLANTALRSSNFEMARSHLESACLQRPDDPVCLNNLAWALTYGPDPDLPRALGLIQSALSLEADRVEFHDTRGHILANLERYSEAIPDLLLGLQSDNDPAATRAVLADAYAAIGQKELAAHYRELE